MNTNSVNDKLAQNSWDLNSPNWRLFGSPLRPNTEDLSFLEKEIFSRLDLINSKAQRVVILGVTPELANLPWLENTEIIAIDSSSKMISGVWHKMQKTQGKAIFADWRKLPLEDNSCDVVLGDGCFTLLDYPNSYHQVLQEVKRILKSQGLFSMRFFLRPSQTENITTIFKELEMGEISNFHLFKLRLARALQTSTTEGIPVAEIYKVWEKTISAPEQLLQKLGWSVDLLKTINMYKNSPSIYTFPTLEEIQDLFSSYFVELSCNFPTYQSGKFFPTIIFGLQKNLSKSLKM